MGGSCTLSFKVLDCLFIFLAEGLGCKVLEYTFSLVTAWTMMQAGGKFDLKEKGAVVSKLYINQYILSFQFH
jgi:hypothetical protein